MWSVCVHRTKYLESRDLYTNGSRYKKMVISNYLFSEKPASPNISWRIAPILNIYRLSGKDYPFSKKKRLFLLEKDCDPANKAAGISKVTSKKRWDHDPSCAFFSWLSADCTVQAVPLLFFFTCSGEPGYAYVDVVRKRDERRKLKGHTCKECEIVSVEEPSDKYLFNCYCVSVSLVSVKLMPWWNYAINAIVVQESPL